MDTTPTLAVLSAITFWNANIKTLPIPSSLADGDIEVSTTDCLPVLRHEDAMHRFVDVIHMPTGYTLKAIPVAPGLLCKAYSRGMGVFAYSCAQFQANIDVRSTKFRIAFYRLIEQDIQCIFQAHSNKEVFSLALSEDSISYCAGRKGDTIYGSCPAGIRHNGDLFVLNHTDNSIAYSTAMCGQNTIMSGTKSGQVLIWDLRRGHRPVQTFSPNGTGAAVRSVRATSDEQQMVALYDDQEGDALLASWDVRQLADLKPSVSYKFSAPAHISGPVLLYDFDETKSGGLLAAVSTMGDLAFWDIKIGGEADLEFGATEDGVPSELSMFGWDDESDSVTPGIFVRNCTKNIIFTPGDDDVIADW